MALVSQLKYLVLECFGNNNPLTSQQDAFFFYICHLIEHVLVCPDGFLVFCPFLIVLKNPYYCL